MDRRVLRVGLLVSAALHVVGIGLAGGWLERDPDGARPRDEPVFAEPPRGMRAIALAPPEPEETPPEPDAPEEPPVPVPDAPPPTAVAVEPSDGPADTITAADRLSARVVDARLWRPMVLLPAEPTIEDVEARIRAAIELMSDSALAAAEAAVAARDWTVEDAEGGRWGISPGQLHLGQLTLPLPIWFPVDAAAAAEDRRWYELDQQLDRARVLDTFRERVEAIRERRDRERAERQEADNGGGGGAEGGAGGGAGGA